MVGVPYVVFQVMPSFYHSGCVIGEVFLMILANILFQDIRKAVSKLQAKVSAKVASLTEGFRSTYL